MRQNVTAALRKRRAARGMTLIEIMVVIAILGLLTAAIAVAVIPRFEEAKRDRTRLDIANLQTALKQYYVKKGKYPDTGSGLKVLVDTQILDKAPRDPWESDYVYLLENNQPVILSYAADKSPGGEGNNADISSKDSTEPK